MGFEPCRSELSSSDFRRRFIFDRVDDSAMGRRGSELSRCGELKTGFLRGGRAER